MPIGGPFDAVGEHNISKDFGWGSIPVDFSKVHDGTGGLETIKAIIYPLLDFLSQKPSAVTLKWPERINTINKIREQLDRILQ